MPRVSLKRYGPGPPAHPLGSLESNGKVERSHRIDEEEFYRRATFRDPHGLARQLQVWEDEYNHQRPHLALNGKYPPERLCELRITAPHGVRRAA